MKHINAKDHELNFELGGRDYKVEARGEVEIPSRFVYAVKGMGLPLEPVPGEEGEEEERVSDERPVELVARLWFDRAVEQRNLVNETKGIVYELRGSLDRAGEARDRLVAELEEVTAGRTAALADLATRTNERDLAIADAAAARASLATAQALVEQLQARVATLEEAAAAPAPAAVKAPKKSAPTPTDPAPTTP